jgi:phytoene dehydrogenase-like protein
LARYETVIVGGGLAGLACARRLAERGRTARLFEASDAVGGRVRTDRVEADGGAYLLDRGFQVFLTAYPEARRLLDYRALDLRPFDAASLVRFGDRFERLADPLRHPLDLPATLLATLVPLADKLRVLKLRAGVTGSPAERLWEREECSVEEALRLRYGFSELIVDRFFRPFFGGILLEKNLERSSSRAFEFCFRMFAEGRAAVPAAGMQAIPEQIAAGLPPEAVRLNTRVTAVAPGAVTLDGGERVEARAVVVATDGPEAAYLLDDLAPPGSRASTTIYWAADAAPVKDRALLLDAESTGPVNSLAVLSNVAPSYAPEGRALLSASVVGNPPRSDEELDAAARAQLRLWFGSAVDGWRRLAVYRILHALPDMERIDPRARAFRLADGLYVTGDWRHDPSINGALAAGRLAADAVLADLGA